MTCTTIDRHCGAEKCLEKPVTERRDRFTRLVSLIGEQLFHYRYVRAELIERALERRSRERGRRT